MKIYTDKGMIELCKYDDNQTVDETEYCFECLIMEGLI